MYKTVYVSPLGNLLLAGDGTSLCGLWLEGQKYYPEDSRYECGTPDRVPMFAATKSWLDEYFGGGQPDCAGLSLAPAGSAFRRLVWDILREIPYGEVVTYGQIAARIEASTGTRSSARAVGGAVGHNPISIIIPCHRVVGTDGSLTGYAGGIDRKTWLLRHEGVAGLRY